MKRISIAIKFYAIVVILFSCFRVQGQDHKINCKMIYSNKPLLFEINPFTSIGGKAYCQLFVSYSTVLFRNTAKNDTGFVHRSYYKDFKILDRSTNNSTFLIVSKDYDLYKKFSLMTGYQYVYLMEIGAKDMKIYIVDIYKEDKKFLLNEVTMKRLVIKADQE